MKRLLLWSVVLLVIVGIGVGVYWAYWLWPAPTPDDALLDRLIEVDVAPVSIMVRAVGRVQAEPEMTLSFGASGLVTEVLVKANDRVRQGQPLLRLDAADAELALERAQAALTMAEAQQTIVLAGATESDLAAAEAALLSAHANYEEVSAGPSSAAYASAVAGLRSAKTSYDELIKGPDSDEIKVLEANLARTKVALAGAQREYDRFAWREGFEASPQAAALQLATIDYDQASAQYNLAAADASPEQIEAAKARIAEAEARVDALESGLDARVKSAAAQVAQAEADLAALQERPTDGEVQVAQAQVAQAKAGVSEAERQLALGVLVAPTSGTVVQVLANNGMVAGRGAPAVLLLDDSALRVVALVNEAFVTDIVVGDEVSVLPDSESGRLARGVVSAVSSQPRMIYGTANYEVIVTLDEDTDAAFCPAWRSS